MMQFNVERLFEKKKKVHNSEGNKSEAKRNREQQCEKERIYNTEKGGGPQQGGGGGRSGRGGRRQAAAERRRGAEGYGGAGGFGEEQFGFCSTPLGIVDNGPNALQWYGLYIDESSS